MVLEAVAARVAGGALAQLARERRERAAQVASAGRREASTLNEPCSRSPTSAVSSQPSSSAANVRTLRRSSTSGASASLAPISPVPRTQPMRGAISCVRAPQASLRARRSRTSSAALVSP